MNMSEPISRYISFREPQHEASFRSDLDGGLWVEFPLQKISSAFAMPVETLGETLGKTPALILALLQEDPNLTVPDIAARISKSGSAVQRSILKLQSAGRLKRTGSRKVGQWEVLMKLSPDKSS